MGIRESLLNTITSVGNSDFVRVVTSAGASSKATVANLAKAIIEDYAGTSLGGSVRSVKGAIDSIKSSADSIASTVSTHTSQINSLNSTLTNFAGWRTGGSFNDYRRTGIYVINGATEMPSTAVATYALFVATAAPITSGTDSSTAKQIACTVNGNGVWSRQYVGGNWSAWVQL